MTEHLGGHLNKNHVDYGAFDYIHKRFGIQSFLDIGCGPPWMVKYAIGKGIEAIGVDGDPALFPNDFIIRNDYTLGFPELGRDFDLGWSVEFLEHVEEKFLPNVFSSFRLCRYIICTHATEVGGGHHHVNCRDENYWIGKFAENGFFYEPHETGKIRESSTMEKGFMRRTGKFFVRD